MRALYDDAAEPHNVSRIDNCKDEIDSLGGVANAGSKVGKPVFKVFNALTGQQISCCRAQPSLLDEPSLLKDYIRKKTGVEDDVISIVERSSESVESKNPERECIHSIFVLREKSLDADDDQLVFYRGDSLFEYIKGHVDDLPQPSPAAAMSSAWQTADSLDSLTITEGALKEAKGRLVMHIRSMAQRVESLCAIIRQLEVSQQLLQTQMAYLQAAISQHHQYKENQHTKFEGLSTNLENVFKSLNIKFVNKDWQRDLVQNLGACKFSKRMKFIPAANTQQRGAASPVEYESLLEYLDQGSLSPSTFQDDLQSWIGRTSEVLQAGLEDANTVFSNSQQADPSEIISNIACTVKKSKHAQEQLGEARNAIDELQTIAITLMDKLDKHPNNITGTLSWMNSELEILPDYNGEQYPLTTFDEIVAWITVTSKKTKSISIEIAKQNDRLLLLSSYKLEMKRCLKDGRVLEKRAHRLESMATEFELFQQEAMLQNKFSSNLARLADHYKSKLQHFQNEELSRRSGVARLLENLPSGLRQCIDLGHQHTPTLKEAYPKSSKNPDLLNCSNSMQGSSPISTNQHEHSKRFQSQAEYSIECCHSVSAQTDRTENTSIAVGTESVQINDLDAVRQLERQLHIMFTFFQQAAPDGLDLFPASVSAKTVSKNQLEAASSLMRDIFQHQQQQQLSNSNVAVFVPTANTSSYKCSRSFGSTSTPVFLSEVSILAARDRGIGESQCIEGTLISVEELVAEENNVHGLSVGEAYEEWVVEVSRMGQPHVE